MSRITEAKIQQTITRNAKIVLESKLDEKDGAKHLAALLSEDPYLKKGQKVYVAGSMGNTNIEGSFQEESNGWARIKREDGTDYWVHYHKCLPK